MLFYFNDSILQIITNRSLLRRLMLNNKLVCTIELSNNYLKIVAKIKMTKHEDSHSTCLLITSKLLVPSSNFCIITFLSDKCLVSLKLSRILLRAYCLAIRCKTCKKFISYKNHLPKIISRKLLRFPN